MRKGSFAAHGRRWGHVNETKKSEAKLTWLDDKSVSGWIKSKELEPVWEWKGDEKKFTAAVLTSQRVYVQGLGKGTVLEFYEHTFSADGHIIKFDAGGEAEVKLRRKGNSETPWLLPPKTTDTRLIWTANGGKAATTRAYTRGASVDDVCMWLHDERGGICAAYAGLMGLTRWTRKGEERTDAMARLSRAHGQDSLGSDST